jgi:hypothetical protein
MRFRHKFLTNCKAALPRSVYSPAQVPHAKPPLSSDDLVLCRFLCDPSSRPKARSPIARRSGEIPVFRLYISERKPLSARINAQKDPWLDRNFREPPSIRTLTHS